MEPEKRYEIIDSIASGDFATVYRAKDRELSRDVAIKQIHPQFLSDPKQLERYWGEAQLLASLQHPNILTIYDLVRPKGWLILELMRGSLRDGIERGPIHLDYLRHVLTCGLQGLKFLHANEIIHGDIKPSTLLVDAQNNIKLGDFGLARRASNDEGSLLKGTTKYMAPELVSDQFGPATGASDLYSLGFAAYELMCGEQFETLFPGLDTFGRDRQIAWLMWQSAPDRQLPEIGRVLQGVPDDLAHVIQRLVTKDPRKRYRTADQALRDLQRAKAPQIADDVDEEAEAAAAEEAKKKRTMRIAAICAMAFSLVMCVVMLLPKSPEPTPTVTSFSGTVAEIDLQGRTIRVDVSRRDDDELLLLTADDEVVINGLTSRLADLQEGDRIKVETEISMSGDKLHRFQAIRPETIEGVVESIDLEAGRFFVTLPDQEEPQNLVPIDDIEVWLNDVDQEADVSSFLDQLQVDDQVVVRHIQDEVGQVALSVHIQRVVESEGVLREFDPARRMMTLALGTDGQGDLLTLPLTAKAEVRINGRGNVGGRLLKSTDLEPGDLVVLAHDTSIVSVEATRSLAASGIVRRIDAPSATVQVLLDGDARPTRFSAGDDCTVTLSGSPVSLTELRPGDTVQISHDSLDGTKATAATISAVRPPDPTRWAVVIGVEDYQDGSLTALNHPRSDATELRDTLVQRYKVPAAQALLLLDPSRVRLEQGAAGLLKARQPEDSVLVYFVGHAYQTDENKVYLAGKDFSLARAAESGVALQWLVDQLEACTAGTKLLILDCSNNGPGSDLDAQPSTAEMLSSLDAIPGRVPLRTVTGIASCSSGQRGRLVQDGDRSVLAAALVDGFAGLADENLDSRIEPTELLAFLKTAMAATATGPQTPSLMLPDNRPPRLSADGKKAIRKLAASLRQDRIDIETVTAEVDAAKEACGDELEPRLLHGLVLLKAKQRTEGLRLFEQIHVENPQMRLPLQAIAWLQLDKRSYESGVEQLLRVLTIVPTEDVTSAEAGETAELLRWMGNIRQFTESVEEIPKRNREALDAAVARLGPDAVRSYEEGRAETLAIVNDLDQGIAETNDASAKSKLWVQRRQLDTYVTFPIDDFVQAILAGLDQ